VTNGEDCEVMISTTPMTLPQLLDDWQKLADQLTVKKKKESAGELIEAAREKAKDLDARADDLAKATNEEPRDEAKVSKLDGQVENAEESLVRTLKKIREIIGKPSKLTQGTIDNPLPIDWPKPAAEDYPTLYYYPATTGFSGPLVTKKTPAEVRKDLKNDKARKQWDAATPVVEEHNPCELSTLPGGEEVGIAEPYQIEKGMKFQMKSSAGTGGGGKINARFAKYGYSAKGDEMDGDHVIERQVGGPDVLANLWPLKAGTNRGSGGTIRAMSFEQDDGTTVTMDEVKDEVKKNHEGVWFKVVSTS
jgi:hypothetical protein